jgi:transposase-like protein
VKPSGKELGMKKSRYTEEQIAFALKQAETGTSVAEVIRRMGVSEQTFTAGRRSMAVSASASCGGLSSSRTRTGS